MDNQSPTYLDWRDSSIGEWLRYDEWHDLDAIKLLANVDPYYSRTGKFDSLDTSETRLVAPSFEALGIHSQDEITVALLNQSSFYSLTLWTEDGTTITQQTQQLWDSEIGAAAGFPFVPSLTPDTDLLTKKLVGAMLTERFHAYQRMFELSRTYFTNTGHRETRTWPPSHYIEWATAKGFEIPWLEWAVEESAIESAAIFRSDSTPNAEQTLKPKREETYQCVIGALLRLLKEGATDQTLARRAKTQDNIISAIHDCVGELHGLSESSLKEYFRAGNDALKRRENS